MSENNNFIIGKYPRPIYAAKWDGNEDSIHDFENIFGDGKVWIIYENILAIEDCEGCVYTLKLGEYGVSFEDGLVVKFKDYQEILKKGYKFYEEVYRYSDNVSN